MQGARRRPYVDMVKKGNAADDAPQRGAGAPMLFRGCDRGGASARVQLRRCGPLPGRTYAYTRRHCSAVRVPWPQPEGTGRSGRISLSVAPNIESMRRRDPPRTASHLASVAHVPGYETGSSSDGKGIRACPPLGLAEKFTLTLLIHSGRYW